MIVYGDILLALNWWLDFLLLLGVRRTLGGGARPWRLALGALAGAFSCFTLFLPPLSVWWSLLIKLASALLMVLIAFRWQGWRQLARRVFLLFALSAGLAGLCGALYFYVAPADFYVANGVVYYAFPPLLLVLLSVVCYGLLWLSEHWMRRRAPAQRVFRVTVTVGENHTTFPCLYDSGNHLMEPFSGFPVLVVERDVAEQIVTVPSDPEELPIGQGWRLIPYDTLKGGGLLPAFMPRRVDIHTRQGERAITECYVAVCDRLGRGEYRGLMGSAMGENLV
ncbi:MAG: sigma-E processing peptidase SpoIIGA [Clostridia bacterium]|nr:sigma-E processing peptidase SpoIIGA [Clostridia bacterium]